MADDNKLDFILDLDSSQFAQKILEGIDRVEGLSSALGGVAVVAGAVGAAMIAVKTAIDLTFEAETVKAINAQFDILAKQAGLAGDAIKEGMSRASGGLLSETEQLQLANKAIIDLGKSASRIPEIMELAREVSMVTGQSLADTFQNIEQAAATGQTRTLKSYGIVVDAEKAYRAYAKSIGSATESLSKAGQAHAILNQVLEIGHQKYSSIEVDVKEGTNAWQAFKATLQDIGDIASIAFDKVGGDKVRSSLQFIKDWARGAKTDFEAYYGQGAKQAAAQTEVLQGKIKDLKVAIIDLEQEQMKAPAFKQGLYASEIASAKEQLKSYEDQLKKTNETKKKLDPNSSFVGPIKPAGVDSTQGDLDPDKQKKAQAQYQKDIVALQEEALNQRKKTMQGEEQAEAYLMDQKIQINEQAEARKDEIRKSDVLDANQQAAEINLIEIQRNEQLRIIEQQRSEIHKQALEQQLYYDESFGSQMVDTARLNAVNAGEQWKKTGGLGGAAMNSFQQRSSAAFKAIGDGSKSASEAMRSLFFGVLGDMATKQGEFMMLDAFKTFPVINGPELAAGAGLIALGGSLGAMSGGGSSPGGSMSGGGGGGGGDLGTGGASLQQQTPQKAVTIQVMGSYFETEQTKQRLVELIRESSDATDFTIK